MLGLIVEPANRYEIISNRESGFGRYDVMLKPREGKEKGNAIIIEFKVHRPKKEKDLKETVQVALRRIEEKNTRRTWKWKDSQRRASASMVLRLRGKRF